MRNLTLAFLVTHVVLVAGASGCGSDGPPYLHEYFTARPYTDPTCNVVDQRLVGQREVRLFVNGNVDILSITQGLARYYSRHSLSFFTQAQPARTAMAYALNTDTTALTLALIEAFPGVDLTDEQALMADPVLWNQITTFIANYVLGPLVQFANEHSGDGPSVTNLVVVGDLERPGGEEVGDPGTTLAGLAISPALLAEFAVAMPEEAAIWQGVDLPDGFTPVMVLGHKVIARFARATPVLRDLVASHEFGHTAALMHTMVERNLMFPALAAGRNDCHDSLDDVQLATMRTTLGVGAAASGALLSARADAGSPGASPRALSVFTPAGLRSVMAGDRRPLRSLVERLIHRRTPSH